MKILFAHICILFPVVLFAQKKLQFELFTPDTLYYDVKIEKDSTGAKIVYADFGTFNYTDEPELNFFAAPKDHPFILDNSLWNVAYLKPVYDRRLTITPGASGKVISFKYISKYNKLFKGPFIQKTSAHTTHGIISFNIKGMFLPRYLHIDTPAFYIADAETGKTITDTIRLKNKGSKPILTRFEKYDEGLLNPDSNKKFITILPGKSKKMILNYTPAQKGSFDKSAILEFHLAGEKLKHRALIKIRGRVSK